MVNLLMCPKCHTKMNRPFYVCDPGYEGWMEARCPECRYCMEATIEGGESSLDGHIEPTTQNAEAEGD